MIIKYRPTDGSKRTNTNLGMFRAGETLRIVNDRDVPEARRLVANGEFINLHDEPKPKKIIEVSVRHVEKAARDFARAIADDEPKPFVEQPFYADPTVDLHGEPEPEPDAEPKSKSRKKAIKHK